MGLKKDIIGAEVQIGSNEAQKSLVDLAQKTSTLTNENDRLRISQAKLKALGKEHKEEYDKVTKAITENNKTIKENKAQMDALRKTIGLTEMSFPQLRKRAAELRKELLDMGDSADTAQFNKLNSELIATERQMGKLKGRIGDTKGTMGALGALLPVLSFAAIAAGVKSLVSNIISVRKEFEKYEAVLTNTLGSNKKARQEMQMLQKFAAETPFALTELTGAFVKLTNYGLKPSREEMRKYGDLASSVGKGMDQLTEAVADATTGEFERLKEFGIKARKEGDKITFTFKEQSIVVDNNTQSIKNYILSLGELQGVSGSMAAIAGTLGGKISNMGDAWDGLMNTLGGGTSGIMITVIGWLTNFVGMLDNAWKSIDMIKQAVKDESIVNATNNAIKEIDVMEKSLIRNGISQAEAHDRAIKLYEDSMRTAMVSTRALFKDATESQKEELGRRLQLLIEEKKGVVSHFKNMDAIKKKQDDFLNSPEKQKEALEKLAKERKDASDKMIAILDESNIERISKLTTQYETEKWTDERFKNEMLAAEQAYLIQKRAFLVQFGQSTIDVDKQINDKRIEAQKIKNAEIIEIDEQFKKNLQDASNVYEQAQKAQQEAEDLALDELIKRTNESIELKNKLEDQEEKSLEKRKQNYLDFANAMGQTFGDLLSDQKATMEDYLKAALTMSLDALHQFLLVKQAEVMIDAALGAATGRFWKVAGAVAAIAAMEAAYQGVRGLLTNGKQAGGFSNSGSDSEPDGVYHKNEFIGSAPTVRNPSIRKVYQIIDLAQKQGKAATLNLPAVMASMGMVPNSRQSGGFASASTSSATAGFPERAAVEGLGMSEATLQKLIKGIDQLVKLKLSIDVKTVKEKMDLLDKYENGGLG